MTTLFENDSITVRRLSSGDYTILAKWLSDARVLKFFEGRDRPHDLRKVQEVFDPKCLGPVVGCIVGHSGDDIGYIQYYSFSDAKKPSYGYGSAEKVYGLDQFIGEPNYWNRGIGTALIRLMADYLFRELAADRVLVDPQTWNTRAIRCYEKSGFRKVRLLPKHEWHEGQMRDCWLMELARPVVIPETGEPDFHRVSSSNIVEFVRLSPQMIDTTVSNILTQSVSEPNEERMNQIHIDQAGPPDIEQVWYVDEIVLQSSRRAGYLAQAIQDNKVWVCRISDRIVGFVVMEPRSFFGNPFVEILIVHPDHRRQGIGTLLMRKVESLCPTDKLFTSTNQSNQKMQRFCESLGFMKSGYIENLDDGDPEIVYFKRLQDLRITDSVHQH